MSVLGTFLKYRLIAFSDLEYIRNNMRLYSKALQKQVTKDFFERVMNMHSSEDDLKMLNLNLVYNLLANFCDIPGPFNGWGNIPDSDEISLGADIERIKMIVNDYFDDHFCEQENLDEVIKRWTESYGEINRSDVIDLRGESKIKCKYIG